MPQFALQDHEVAQSPIRKTSRRLQREEAQKMTMLAHQPHKSMTCEGNSTGSASSANVQRNL
jgi:hypothetical protein